MFNFENYSLDLWNDSLDDENHFIQEIVRYISPIYDEIGKTFAFTLLNIFRKGYDEYGYFTLAKDIWVLKDVYTRNVAAYEVVTRKRGGSIKIGPTIVLPQYQRKGLARKIILLLEEHYTKMGCRKIYATSPINHLGAAALDYNGLGWKTEAIMMHQYRVGEAERVAGKLLKNISLPSPKIQSEYDELLIDQQDLVIKVGLKEEEEQQFIDMIIQLMPQHYDDIDESFGRSIIKAEKRFTASKEEKGKAILNVFINGQLIAIIISTPKRGGSVKLSPILIKPGFRTSYLIEKMFKYMIDWYEQNFSQYKRFYTLIPTQDYYLIRMICKLEWRLEGILKEPYKVGVDVLLFAKEEG